MSIINKDDYTFLDELTAAVVEASRVRPGEKVGDIGPNTTGETLLRPGGRNAYPAFWIRDYAMSLEANCFSLIEQRHALRLTAAHQVDKRIGLPSGSYLPPGSIADHITFGGVPIYFPGILEDYKAQGGPLWGTLPCLDDHFYFVHMAHHYFTQTKDTAFLGESANGVPLIDRLDRAFFMPPSRAENLLVFATNTLRGVNFGFYDTIKHTGNLLMASLLKWRAAKQLAELHTVCGNHSSAKRYEDSAAVIGHAVPSVFGHASGFLRASTGTSRQRDVWGTAFAVYIGLLEEPLRAAACEALLRAYRAGTMTWRGQIRHVLTTDDYSDSTAWEESVVKVRRNRYQNGAYWATPVGWVAYALHQVDPEAASTLVGELIAEFREDDFRKGDAFGAPWECMHEEDNHRQNPVYMTSVTCPLAAVRRMLPPE